MNSMIDSLKNWWMQIKCKHQYEILYEYIYSNWHPHYGTTKEVMYKLYCPYCDGMSFEHKDTFDRRENIQILKDEIKNRVLGGKNDD